MERKLIKLSGAALSVAGLLFLASCDESPVLGSESPTLEPSVSHGIPASELNRVSWKPEVVEKLKLKRLYKTGTSTKNVTPQGGGQVGGSQTFGNTVDIPAGALSEKTRITVKVACEEGKEQCGSEIDFLPNLQFDSDVKVTLSWEYLDYTGGELNFSAFFSEDGGATWHDVQVTDVDYDKKTLSIYVDHFTRFAWAL